MTKPNQVDITSPDFIANPYPTYQALRQECPFHKITTKTGEDAWLVSKFEDVISILKDDEKFTVDMTQILPTEVIEPFIQIEHVRILMFSMLTLDGQEHHRLRRLMQKAFTPRMIERLRPRIQHITDEILNQVQSNGKMELVSEFAFPIPITVISEMVGIPPEDRPFFVDCATKLLAFGDSLEGLMASEDVMIELSGYLRTQFEQRRKNPTEDLMSDLIHIEDEGQRLNEAELISMIILILIAGYETTGNLIANSVLTLLRHPDQLNKLRQQPQLIQNAVEELLRHATAVHAPVTRWATQDVRIGDVTIAKGEQVLVLLASANHDEGYFVNGEQLNIFREPSRILSFGHGVHYCLGAPLARLEAEIAINTLIQRFPNLHLLSETIEWNEVLESSGIIRALKRLDVGF